MFIYYHDYGSLFKIYFCFLHPSLIWPFIFLGHDAVKRSNIKIDITLNNIILSRYSQYVIILILEDQYISIVDSYVVKCPLTSDRTEYKCKLLQNLVDVDI